jgi:hypothetical protein
MCQRGLAREEGILGKVWEGNGPETQAVETDVPAWVGL